MFSKNQITRITGEEITLSSEMISAYELWDNMLLGKAPWTEENENDGVISLRLEGSICKEFADTTLSEIESSLEIPELDEIYQRTILNLNDALQTALGLGEMAIKPLGNTGMFETIPADRIVPLEFGANGRLRRCAFIQAKPIGDRDIYYRLELHELTNEGLRIANKAFKGTGSNIGQEIPLNSVEEWATLIPDVVYRGMDRMDFGFYKNPLANRVDKSDNGVSIFSNAVNLIKRADIQYGRLDWEYNSGERSIFGDYGAFDIKKDANGKRQFKMPKGKERLYVPVNIDASGNGSDFWSEFSPQLRDSNYNVGLETYKREVERVVGLAYGDLSRMDTVAKTASEIEASKVRKYNSVSAIQEELKKCLEDYAYALAFYHGLYTAHLGFQCAFHDSILVDDETKRAQDRTDVQLGLMSKLEYRMKWYGEDRHTAEAALREVQEEINGAADNEGDVE